MSNYCDDQYRDYAQKWMYREGELEIDDGATVSAGEDSGAYVQAWVWVDDSSMAGKGYEEPTDEDTQA